MFLNLNKGLFISFCMHVALIVFMIVKVSFFSKNETLLSHAIRVDMVGLPEKYNTLPPPVDKPQESKKNEPPPKEEPPPKQEAKPASVPPQKAEAKSSKAEADSVNLNKNKQKQKEALEKLKKLSAIEKIREQVTKEKAQQNTPPQPIKGRVISKGTALTGLDKIQSDNYLLQLDAVIKNHWQLPQWLIGKNLKTKILVKIDPSGNIAARKIMQSSGNPTYDEYCLQAVDKSAPFPKVPEKFTEVYKEDGVLIGFPE